MNAHLRPRECQPNGMTETDAPPDSARNRDGATIPIPIPKPYPYQPPQLPKNPASPAQNQPDTSHLNSESLAKYFHNNLYGTTRKIEKSSGQNCYQKKPNGKHTAKRIAQHEILYAES